MQHHFICILRNQVDIHECNPSSSNLLEVTNINALWYRCKMRDDDGQDDQTCVGNV